MSITIDQATMQELEKYRARKEKRRIYQRNYMKKYAKHVGYKYNKEYYQRNKEKLQQYQRDYDRKRKLQALETKEKNENQQSI